MGYIFIVLFICSSWRYRFWRSRSMSESNSFLECIWKFSTHLSSGKGRRLSCTIVHSFEYTMWPNENSNLSIFDSIRNNFFTVSIYVTSKEMRSDASIHLKERIEYYLTLQTETDYFSFLQLLLYSSFACVENLNNTFFSIHFIKNEKQMIDMFYRYNINPAL